MPFNPAIPVQDSPLNSAEMRSQFNGLKELIDEKPGASAVVHEPPSIRAKNIVRGLFPDCPNGFIGSIRVTVSNADAGVQVSLPQFGFVQTTTGGDQDLIQDVGFPYAANDEIDLTIAADKSGAFTLGVIVLEVWYGDTGAEYSAVFDKLTAIVSGVDHVEVGDGPLTVGRQLVAADGGKLFTDKLSVTVQFGSSAGGYSTLWRLPNSADVAEGWSVELMRGARPAAVDPRGPGWPEVLVKASGTDGILVPSSYQTPEFTLVSSGMELGASRARFQLINKEHGLWQMIPTGAWAAV